MSNPTTPFSWQMPTATDLVTDLPADFEVFGQAVATSMADLLGGTTGQYLTKNTSTDMDFVWASAPSSGLVFLTGTSFSAVSSVSLPTNTFSNTYLNYKIIFNITAAAAPISETRIRLRAAGADNTSAVYSNGGYEINSAGGGAASSGQTQTSVLWGNMAASTAQFTQFEITMFSPKAAVYTAFNINGSKGTATWKAMTGFHESTTSFDSMTFYPDAGTITGSYRVYGIANS